MAAEDEPQTTPEPTPQPAQPAAPPPQSTPSSTYPPIGVIEGQYSQKPTGEVRRRKGR